MEEPERKKLKVAKNWILGIIIAVLVSSGVYWVFVRPSLAKSSCHKFARDAAGAVVNPNKPGQYYYNSTSDYDFAFKTCLHQKGL